MKERPKSHRTDSGRAVKSSQAPHNQLFNCDPTWDGKQSSGKKQDHSSIGGQFVQKSGLRILIRAPELPFSIPQKTLKRGHFGVFLVLKMGAQIKIPRPLFNTNQPPKTHLRNPNRPSKSVFWPKKTQKRVFSKSHNGQILKFCQVIPTTKVQIKTLSLGMVLVFT